MDRKFHVVLVLFYLLFTVWKITGLNECRDFEPSGCQERVNDERCDNPGIATQCMKTCRACTTNGNDPQCTPGHVDNGTACIHCADYPLEDLFTNRLASCPQKCPSGQWGSNCQKACPSCSQGSCEQWSGRCLGNCPTGRYGSRCELHCENCLHGSCCANGRCQYGCKRRWKGPRCYQHDDVV